MKKEIAVAWASDLKDGEMREVSADGTQILLARIGDEYHAVALIARITGHHSRKGCCTMDASSVLGITPVLPPLTAIWQNRPLSIRCHVMT